MSPPSATPPAKPDSAVLREVADYYSRVLQTSTDLKTNACCTATDLPRAVKAALSNIHPEVLSKYYGCGVVAPQDLVGRRVLDLGCGAGRDVYVLAQFVGPAGAVAGVDMTPEQVAVAQEHSAWHAERFGYKDQNTQFHTGFIEDLRALGIADASVDVVVSNCVVNLSPRKEAVLAEAFRVLKPGGEMYFSDVYSDRRVPRALVEDPVLFGECLSGALYFADFVGIAKAAGFRDPRLVEDSRITIENAEVEEKIGHIRFFSATYRLFKLHDLETHCEDYGQAVVYKGSLAECPKVFELDAHHRIEAGKVFPVCGNTYRMLHDTRFQKHFDFIGDMSTHYGIYADCGTPIPFASAATGDSGAAGGCC